MKVTLYLAHEKDGTLKDRERVFGEALRAGFEKHGEQVAMVPTHEFVQPDFQSQLAVVIGIKGHSKRIFEEYRRGGRQVMLVDKSYFGRTEYVRLSVNGFQPPYAHLTRRPHDRWNKIRSEFRIDVRPKRASGATLIYAGSSQKYCDWHDLGDVSEHANRVCRALGKTARGSALRILYRPKPSWAAGHPDEVKQVPNTEFSGPYEKLGKLLGDCHALVTHGSNAAVEAVIAGVPAVVISKGACAAEPVADLHMSNVLDPAFPTDAERLQFLANLAYCQFNMTELKNGIAWELIAPHTVKAALEGIADLPADDTVIAQYRMMHMGPKMFRGGSLRGHVDAVADLVRKYQPESLLDYGSGKGRQYDDLQLHQQWGGLKPACYDPGYPPIAEKPKGQFGGVLCTDVAEHIPESGIDAFLADVIGYARKFVFFCIYTAPSRKFLPDGRNCHLTTRPRAWWIDRICSVTGGKAAGAFLVSRRGKDGEREDVKHYTIKAPNKPDVIVTFRGSD